MEVNFKIQTIKQDFLMSLLGTTGGMESESTGALSIKAQIL